MDLACGSGREAVWLALAGYEVEAIDVLPDALERAADLARRSGVRLTAILQDLKRSPTLPQARYDLVAVLRFLHRPLLGAIRESVAPGGWVVYEAFHRRDAAKGRRLKEAHTLEDGELAAAFAGYDTLIARDGVERDGRVFSQLLGRRDR
jgi:SAM-dependent methyltransferase